MRDEGRDRRTGQLLMHTRRVHPRRGEVHHVTSRNDPAVRFDRRNLILVSLTTHAALTDGLLRIVGTRYFTLDGKRYVDTDFPVRFVEVA